MNDFFLKEHRSALEAKFEAQKIAFGPYAFQASRSLRNMGILSEIEKSGESGITANCVAQNLSLSYYAVNTLLEFALSMELVKLKDEQEPFTFVLSKIGHFLINDPMTIANMDFMHDVCYEGAFSLEASMRTGKPTGLEVFGTWNTVYEALATLPVHVKESWFAFDHHYSDIAFPQALPIVLKNKPARLMDIGGNTAKWAIACANFDPNVKVTIVDLPGQVKVALENVSDAGFIDRIDAAATNILDPNSTLATGADIVWMSQFLDCFALHEIETILKKVYAAVDPQADIYVLEPLWDQQRFPAAAYSLHATSLYFSNIANGNSKMYRLAELVEVITKAGFTLEETINGLGIHDYSLLRFRKVASK